MTLSEREVRAALLRATDHLAAPPHLLEDVRRGGQRRVWRRRAVLTGGLAVVAAASAGAVLRPRAGVEPEPLDPSSPLFSEPTRGDRAGDEAYLREVRRQWTAMNDPLPRMRGEPHVWWAGDTPAGPAAFIAQRGGTGAAVGWIEPTPGGPRVSNVTPVSRPESLEGVPQAILLGPDRDVLLLLDFGWPVEFSPSLSYAADGKVVRSFEPFAFQGGAGWRLVGRQVSGITVALRRQWPVAPDQVYISNATHVLYPRPGDVPAPPRLEYTLPGAEGLWEGQARAFAHGGAALEPYADRYGTHGANPDLPDVTVYGRTPYGGRLLALTLQFDDGPSRVVVLAARRETDYQVVASGFANWRSALPVSLPLAGGLGTLAVAPGAALEYRAAGETAWRPAGRDAALLPSTAVEARVLPRTGPAVDVPLR